MKNYKVTAACVVHVPMNTDRGRSLATLYQDTVFVGDPASTKIKHLLDSKMIVEVGGAAEPAARQVQGDGSVEAGGDLGEESPPTTGPGSGKDTWVDYAVQRGMSREDAEGMSRADLIKALKPSE